MPASSPGSSPAHLREWPASPSAASRAERWSLRQAPAVKRSRRARPALPPRYRCAPPVCGVNAAERRKGAQCRSVAAPAPPSHSRRPLPLIARTVSAPQETCCGQPDGGVVDKELRRRWRSRRSTCRAWAPPLAS
uniref:Uncharacterized protein n=1 Tax=Arundo donax TaxID=35708 RepID=A0A0A9CTL4_ARUDO